MYPGASYEEQHNSFVTSRHGCSPFEILQVLTSVSLMPILTSLTIPWVVPSSFTKLTANNPRAFACIRGVIEYPIVFIAPIFFITIFAGPGVEEIEGLESASPITPCMTIAAFLACIGIITVNQAITRPVWSGFREEWNKIRGKSINWSAVGFSLEKVRPGLPGQSATGLKLPFVTNYRGLVTYLTVLSILAVDLVIFPRRFAKTKKFGFSLMDVGTGCFMFANGIVSPESRNMKPNFRKALISSVPLLALGFIRLVTVKGMEYPEVEEEYGVHWNFFFTLAAVKILSSVLFRFVPTRAALKLACAIGFFYDLLIIPSEFQDSYILNPNIPRDSSLIAANREGLFSIPGYLTIFLASIYVGQVIFNNVKGRRTLEDWAYYGIQSSSHLLILWFMTFVTHSFWSPVCRRSANLSYVLWVISINYTILWLQFSLCYLQVVLQRLGLIQGPLIFYELRQKNMKKFQTFVQNKEKESEEENTEETAEDVEMEATLQELAKKLEYIHDKVRNTKNPDERIELTDITKDIEKEIEEVGAKCLAAQLKKVGEGMKAKTPAGDLVEMPDFTRAAVMLEGISYNGLGVFLLANLLTGLVNSMMYTMYLPNSFSLLILWTYASVVGFTSLILYYFNIQVKFW